MVKVKLNQVLDGPPKQGASYVMNLPQPPLRNSEEYLKAYVGYIYTAVGAIAQEVASIELHLYKTTYTKRGPVTQEIFEHPALSILHYVNSISTLYDIIEATQTYLELTGEAFWVALKDASGMPQELWLLRPDWVKVIPHPTKVIDHYNYYAGGVSTEKVEIPKENVIPFKYFNPLNPYRGKGSTQAAALPFDILNFAGEYNRNFFFNSALPSMVFSSDQKISEQSIKRFLNQWQDAFGGRSKSNKVAFLGQGLKLDKASFAAKELDFAEQMKTMRDDVLAVFKVPKTVLGLTEDVNRANADSTTRAFMERVITPRMRKFVDALNEFYLPMFTGGEKGVFFDFYDPAPEDVEMKLKKYENARKYNWMTPNEIRAEENLDPLPGGDELFSELPSSLPPAEGEQAAEEDSTVEEEDEPVKPTGEEEAKGLVRRIKSLFNKPTKQHKVYAPPANLKKKGIKHMVRVPAKPIEKIKEEQMAAKFVPLLKTFIAQLISQDDYTPLKDKKETKGQYDSVLKKALKEIEVENKEKEDALQLRINQNRTLPSVWDEASKTKYWNDFIKAVDTRESDIKEVCQTIFKAQEALVLSKLETAFKSWWKRLGLRNAPPNVVPTLTQLSAMWDALEAILEDVYIDQGNETLAALGIEGEINITTQFAVAYLDEYSGVLIKGINQTTRDALMATLSEGYEAGEGVDKLAKRVREVFEEADVNRSQMIARTESLRASNSASVEAYRQSNVVEGKEWLTERDATACPFCLDLDGKIVSLNTNYFDKGDELTVNGQTMKFEYTDVGEPPAHVACRCTTIPVLIK